MVPHGSSQEPSCGTNRPGFGIIDTCANASFTAVTVLPNQVLTEPNQDQWTFYTGQSITLSWATSALDNTEVIIFSVYTPTLRNVLGGTTNVPITPYSVTRRISESTGTSVVTSSSPVLFSTLASAGINGNSEVKIRNSTQVITILQSRMMNNVEAFWNGNLLTTAVIVPFTDQRFVIRWSAVGNADVGTATITLNRCSNGGTNCNQASPSTNTIIGNPLSVPLGNTTPTMNEATFLLSRSANNVNPGDFYHFVVNVNPGNGGNTFVYASAGFEMGNQVTATPSPTRSQTPTNSPTSSNSVTPTRSSTPTISLSSSNSATSSISASPTRPQDIAAILREQADRQKADAASTSGVVGGVIGGVIFVGILGFIIFKVIQRRQSAERRQRKLAATRRSTSERESVYGVSISPVDKPSDKDIANLAAYKAATKAQYNPMIKASSLTAPTAKTVVKTVGRGSGRSLNRV